MRNKREYNESDEFLRLQSLGMDKLDKLATSGCNSRRLAQCWRRFRRSFGGGAYPHNQPRKVLPWAVADGPGNWRPWETRIQKETAVGWSTSTGRHREVRVQKGAAIGWTTSLELPDIQEVLAVSVDASNKLTLFERNVQDIVEAMRLGGFEAGNDVLKRIVLRDGLDIFEACQLLDQATLTAIKCGVIDILPNPH